MRTSSKSSNSNPMEPSQNNWIVISLGGSLVVPDRVDGDYVRRFSALVREEVALGRRIAIITGGGKVAREYRDALARTGVIDPAVLDQIGITVTRLNAELFRQALRDVADSEIFLDPLEVVPNGKPVLIGGGWKPGHSSDGAAIGLAQALGAKKVVNLSNIDHVYTADPRKDPTATPIETISWTEFRKLLPKDWDPGLSAPFDPIAAGMAQDLGIEVAVMNGHDLENLKNYFAGEASIGTIISN